MKNWLKRMALAACLLVSVSWVNADEAEGAKGPAGKKISLSVKEMTPGIALGWVAKLSGTSIQTVDIPKDAPKVTFDLRDASALTAVQWIAKLAHLTYTVRADGFVVSAKEVTTAE